MKKTALTIAGLSLLLTACGEAQIEPEATPAPEATEVPLPDATGTESLPSMMNARGTFVSGSGIVIGDANLIEGPNGLLLRVTINPGGLEPGWHGLHLHQVGDCSDFGVFTNSGGHVGKVEGGHGLLNPAGPEGGDIPNIWAGADGSAGYETFTTLTTGAELLDENGSAIIIHTAEDDHLSQPIGGAGARVACAVLN